MGRSSCRQRVKGGGCQSMRAVNAKGHLWHTTCTSSYMSCTRRGPPKPAAIHCMAHDKVSPSVLQVSSMQWLHTEGWGTAPGHLSPCLNTGAEARQQRQRYRLDPRAVHTP